MSDKFRVLILDGISPKGVEVLDSQQEIEVEVAKPMKEEVLLEKLPNFDAVAVRSATKIPRSVIEKCDRLKAVGRAGVGVDNVDVDAATEKGIVVMNTPGGNTISTAELAFTLLLSVARNVPQADASVKAAKWERKSFQGAEVHNKVLGIVGMGRIGTEVCRRAIAFGMRVLAFDPYLSVSRSRSLQVELYDDLDEMLPECDFVTLHIPMTEETKGLINKERLQKCKSSLRIVNCARGGLIDEKALAECLEAGTIAGAALDVYEQEPPSQDSPLLKQKNIVLTPHLGASTAEAQESVGIEIAESIRDLLLTNTVRNAVNMPNVDARTLETLRPYLELASNLGLVLAQMVGGRCEELTLNYAGKLREMNTTSITRSAVMGFLKDAGGDEVNEVNALKYADAHGLSFNETKSSKAGNFSELMTLKAKRSDGAEYDVSGTFFGTSPRIVRVNGYSLEAVPEGVLLIMQNEDRPGIVGWIGSLLGKHDLNIASMSLSRSEPGTKAWSVFNLDSKPSEELLSELRADKHISVAVVVEI